MPLNQSFGMIVGLVFWWPLQYCVAWWASWICCHPKLFLALYTQTITNPEEPYKRIELTQKKPYINPRETLHRAWKKNLSKYTVEYLWHSARAAGKYRHSSLQTLEILRKPSNPFPETSKTSGSKPNTPSRMIMGKTVKSQQKSPWFIQSSSSSINRGPIEALCPETIQSRLQQGVVADDIHKTQLFHLLISIIKIENGNVQSFHSSEDDSIYPIYPIL